MSQASGIQAHARCAANASASHVLAVTKQDRITPTKESQLLGLLREATSPAGHWREK